MTMTKFFQQAILEYSQYITGYYCMWLLRIWKHSQNQTVYMTKWNLIFRYLKKTVHFSFKNVGSSIDFFKINSEMGTTALCVSMTLFHPT